MVKLTEFERKERRGNALRETLKNMTRAQKIHRAFVAGRLPATELRTAGEAIGLAKILLRELQASMTEVELNPADCAVKIACTDVSTLSMGFIRKFVPGQESQLHKDLSEQPFVMLGLLFGIVDRDEDPEGNVVVSGIKPFIVCKQVVGWLQEMITAPLDN